MQFCPGLLYLMLMPLSAAGGYPAQDQDPPPEKSAYFAYVDREFIFTIEVVKPGIPILNFVSLVDREENLRAKNILLAFSNRRVAPDIFHIEAARNRQPFKVTSLRMRPRSSFGFRLEGNFGKVEELHGVEIKLENEEFRLTALSKFDFETLALKVNRLNLGSPDFADDFRVLKLKSLGNRSSKRR